MDQPNGQDNPEIGRELKASEISAGTVVVIVPPGQDIHFTMNVIEANGTVVIFGSPVVHMLVINTIADDDTLKDDLGRVVHVYEYLGT